MPIIRMQLASNRPNPADSSVRYFFLSIKDTTKVNTKEMSKRVVNDILSNNKNDGAPTMTLPSFVVKLHISIIILF